MSEQVKAHEVASMFEKCILITRNSKHDIFFNYHPHVNGISVLGYDGGWCTGADGTMLKANSCINGMIYLDDVDLFNRVNNELDLILIEV